MSRARILVAPRAESTEEPFLEAFRDLFVEGTLLLRKLAREQGLSLPQLMVLKTVYKGGPRRASELAEEMDIAPPAVTVLVTGLESRGWVTRTRSAGDRRSVEIDLTAKARRLLAEMNRQRIAVFQRVLSTVSPDQAREITAAMRKIAEGLRAERSSEAPTSALTRLS